MADVAFEADGELVEEVFCGATQTEACASLLQPVRLRKAG